MRTVQHYEGISQGNVVYPQVYNISDYSLYILYFKEYIKEYFQCVRYQMLHSDEQILKLKTALWTVVRPFVQIGI